MGFDWHPAARVFDAVGRAVVPMSAASGVIVARPAGVALALAFAAGAFRIGGAGPVPVAGFETLTAGSSGAPRRIARSHASWQRSFAVNAGLFGIGPGVRVGIPGQLVQSLALYGAVEAVSLGAEVHLLDGMRPDRQARALARRRVQVIYAAPVQVRMLVAAGVPLPELRLALIGGAKVDAGLRAGLAVIAPGCALREFYGAAETSFITLADAQTPEGSVGRAYPGVEIAVDQGVIRVRSPYLFDGYAGGDGPAVWRAGWL